MREEDGPTPSATTWMVMLARVMAGISGMTRKREGDAAAGNFDWQLLLSHSGYWGLISGGRRCGRLRWRRPRFRSREVRNGCAGRSATNRCKGHRGFPAIPAISAGVRETI